MDQRNRAYNCLSELEHLYIGSYKNMFNLRYVETTHFRLKRNHQNLHIFQAMNLTQNAFTLTFLSIFLIDCRPIATSTWM